jgi:hypothetical protein
MRGVRPLVELVLESNSLVGCPMSSSDCSNVIPAVGDRQGDSCLSSPHMGVSPWGAAGLGVNPNGASGLVMVAYRPDVPEAGGVAAHSVRNCVRLGSHVVRRHRSSYSSPGVEGGGLSYPWLALSRRVRRFYKARRVVRFLRIFRFPWSAIDHLSARSFEQAKNLAGTSGTLNPSWVGTRRS